ncbi:hypothetical protein [Alteromonas halophila]|uniref:Uncharacterized protein n=1 Tax=Alteromonas halophila TaxID=516698 RepID=A0A918MYM4_9ALTE|nr:hypothetical protein [Alteromonas halophila]GGW83721.1 hypothetical protein GCM10007391_16630 [Alteromonas halophila]
MFKALARKYVELKYRRNNWRIIENLSAEQFAVVLRNYREDGWELTNTYRAFDASLPDWKGKLRKGTSTLDCQWNASGKGRIIGQAQVMGGVADKLGVSVHTAPTFR